MLTAQQYRVKAAEYADLADTARSDSEGRELRALERNCTSLAANKEWLAGDRTAPVSSGVDRARAEEEQILKSFGTAVIMRWNTLPRRIQRELFAHAGYIGNLQQMTESKGHIARFLHHHALHDHEDGRAEVG
jgi:hypothetical protein